ncbi:MAG: ATP-binding protein [Chloroflexi bacterium]|nr:ATP-binding protein [Chloroflexota bacterium]
MTRRQESIKLLEAYEAGISVYLAGPVGAGKTHIVRSVPEQLLRDQSAHSGFFVYVSRHQFVWDSCHWQSATSIQVGFLHPSGRSGQRIWRGWQSPDAVWEELGLPSVDEFGGDHLGNSEAWPKLFEALKGRGYRRLVIILDDYDQWSSENQVAAWLAMRKCMSGQGIKTGSEDIETIFWLTGETPLWVLRDQVEPSADVAVAGTKLLLCSTPSRETIREIITDSLSEAPAWLNDKLQEPEAIRQIMEITGAYPVLAQCFTNELSTLADKIEDWGVLTSAAKGTVRFQTHLRCLYEALSEPQKQTLGILTIAAKSDYRNAEIRAQWERRFPDIALRTEEFEQALDSLVKNRLLVRRGNAEYQISGSALLEWVHSQTITWALRAQSGVQVEATSRGRQLIFVRWLFLGIIWYVCAVITRTLWQQAVPVVLLQSSLFLAGFIPALFYFTVHFLGSFQRKSA